MSSSQSNDKRQHVLPSLGGGWSVRRYGAAKATKTFDNKTKALRFARDLAGREEGEVFVHGPDGAVVSRDSFKDSPDRRG